MESYCKFTENLEEDNLHKRYHDDEYGYPLNDDDLFFERLVLEINQAGLSWLIILKKMPHFKKAYDNFIIAKVASYKENDIARLLNDAGIIRNRLKINAAVHNAKEILTIQKEFGSFKNWLEHHHPLSREDWVKLFKKTFKFTGGEITNEFLTSTSYLKGAHEETCPIYKKIAKLNPAFLR